jgi:hypothetical protein
MVSCAALIYPVRVVGQEGTAVDLEITLVVNGSSRLRRVFCTQQLVQNGG